MCNLDPTSNSNLQCEPFQDIYLSSCSSPPLPPRSKAAPPTTALQPIGFDSNDYPGDDALPILRRHFAFAGYWLTNPPGERTTPGSANATPSSATTSASSSSPTAKPTPKSPAPNATAPHPPRSAHNDAATAIAAAQREHFPAHTILFLDQEEGGRLNANQSTYLLAWTEAVAHANYLPGVYASGQPVDDAPGKTITTIQNIRELVAAQHLHEIAFWVYQDACPPANGCTLTPPPITASGTPDVIAWQYAQSPRRKEITAACAKTYAPDNNCYAPNLPNFTLDLSVATTADPSHGR